MQQLTTTTHPDFQDGLQEGMQAFLDGVFYPEHCKVWTEDDIIALVNEELSGSKYRYQKRFEELMGRSSLSYSHNLGFIMGYVQSALGIVTGPVGNCDGVMKKLSQL